MNTLAPWIHTSLAQALGWALVHFVWEGAALAILLMAMLAPSAGRPRGGAMPSPVSCWRRCPWLSPLLWRCFGYAGRIAVALPIHWVATAVSAPLDRPAGAAILVAGMLDRLAWLVPPWCAGVAFFYARGLARMGGGPATPPSRRVCAPGGMADAGWTNWPRGYGSRAR